MLKRAIFPSLLAIFLVIFTTNALAADPAGNFTGLLDLIQQSATNWDARLRGYAIKLFWGLATIYFVWTFFPLVFKQADLGEIVGELIRFILTIGFFFALLIYAKEWAEAIVESFKIAGANAAGLGEAGLAPADIFTTAVELAKKIGETKTLNPVAGVMIGLAAAIVMLCFAFIGAYMAVTIIESYIVINAAVLFMGFGGSAWTRDYALAIARYAVSVGAKLFVLTLIVGLINQSAIAWKAAYTSDDASMWTMVGLALACAYIAKTIPDLIQGIIAGSSTSNGAGVGGMAAVALAGATAGAAAASSFMQTAGATANAAGQAAGGSDLAKSLGDSLSTSSGTNPGQAATSGLAGNSDSVAPRLGGSANPSSSTSPANPNSSNNSSSSNNPGGSSNLQGSDTPKQSSGPQQAAQQAENGKKSNPGDNTAAAQGLANAAVRAGGMMSALSVPGMEGAASLSLGSPTQDNTANTDTDSSDFAQNATEENVIRPSDMPQAPVSDAPQSPLSPSSANSDGAFHETAINENDVDKTPKGEK